MTDFSLQSPPSSSRNDIFNTSWKAAPPPPLPVSTNINNQAGLGRSKTTGSLLLLQRARRSRIDEPSADTNTRKFIVVEDPFKPLEYIRLADRDDSTPKVKTIPLINVTGATERYMGDASHHILSPSSTTTPADDHHMDRTLSFFGGPPHQPLWSPISPTTSEYTNTTPTTTTVGTNPSLSSVSFPMGHHKEAGVDGELSDGGKVEVRLHRDKRYLLGTGRYSKVYLGSFQKVGPLRDGSPRRGPDGTLERWNVCAVKVLEPDEESQKLGLREAWMLRHLAASREMSDHPGKEYLVSLLGIKRGGDEPDNRTARLTSHVRCSSSPDVIPPSSLIHSNRHHRGSSLDLAAASSVLPASTSSHPLPLVLLLSYAPVTLADVIHHHPHLLTREVYLRIAYQLAQALSFLHSEHIIHTDLKPHNILLTSDLDVRIADFNTALHLPSLSSPPIDPVGLGTPVYSPPEFNKPPPSPFGYPTDVWTFGVVMMVALVRREPYAELVSGRKSKGGGRGHELKLWLGKGAYWAWEERERLDEISEPSVVTSTAPASTTRIGADELKLLGVEEEALSSFQTPSITSGAAPTAVATSRQPYHDGSPPLYYPGSPHVRVPQAVISLLRKCCTAAPDARPPIDSVVQSLEALLTSVDE